MTLDKTANRLAYIAVGNIIEYSYLVTSTGTAPVAGPISVADDKVTVVCPNVNTVGNNDANLDPGESITCTASHSVVQGDLDAGSITNTASASGDAGSTVSNTDQLTLIRIGSQSLTAALVITPDVTSYDTVGTIIHYTYRVTNTGANPVAGPIVIDSNVSSDEACPAVNTVGNNDNNLDPNEVIFCTSTYTVVQADIDNGSITNTATASGDNGLTTTNTVMSTVNANGTTPSAPTAPIPTFGGWAMILLSSLFLMMGAARLRRRQKI